MPLSVTTITVRTGKHHKDYISWFAARSKNSKACLNVLLGGHLANPIVHQNEHVTFLKAMDVHEELLHIVYIVVACLEFAFLPRIVDTNQEGSLVANISWWDNVHCFVDINLATARELRILQYGLTGG